jgi:hypothetical protein
MVLAFLQAEIRSPSYEQGYREGMNQLGTDATLVDNPNLNEATENAARRRLLGFVRGFESRTALFNQFPQGVRWALVCFGRDELGDLLYAKYPTWLRLSEWSRRVRHGAANLDRVHVPNTTENIYAVERDMQAGKSYPPIIVVAKLPETTHVIAEGHTRATAAFRVLGDDADFEAIAGYSDQMHEWLFW